jgi:hypothetical protein
MALVHQGERYQVLIAAPLTDRGGLGRGGVRPLVVTAGRLLKPDRNQQVSVLDALTRLTFEEALRAREPAGRGGRLPSKHQVPADPERAARGARRLAGVQMGAMSTLQAAHVLVVAAEHVGRPREQLDILRAQRGRLIDSRQNLVGIRPRTSGVTLTAPLDLGDAIHRG